MKRVTCIRCSAIIKPNVRGNRGRRLCDDCRKDCPKCGARKSDRYQAYCRDCMREYLRNWRASA